MIKIAVSAFALALVATGATNAYAQDVAAGEKAYAKCRACHQVGEKARNVVGPILNGLFGRKSGTVPGYNYSKANKEANIVWTPENFAEYIRNPRAAMPGNKMAFAGIKSDKEIADLTAFLMQFNEDGTRKK